MDWEVKIVSGIRICFSRLTLVAVATLGVPSCVLLGPPGPQNHEFIHSWNRLLVSEGQGHPLLCRVGKPSAFGRLESQATDGQFGLQLRQHFLKLTLALRAQLNVVGVHEGRDPSAVDFKTLSLPRLFFRQIQLDRTKWGQCSIQGRANKTTQI